MLDAVILIWMELYLDTLEEDLTDTANASLEAGGASNRTLEEIRQFVGNGVRRTLMSRAVPQGTSEQKMEECLTTWDFTHSTTAG